MRIRGLRKNYQVSGRCLEVLKGLDLDLADEGITVVLGRSGCGKTTLLRLIAGLETADWGEITGGEMTDPGKIGVIFQEPRLMPWLSVERNILFGVKKKERNKEKLSYLLRLTGLTGFEKARPFQLSGGMQQRVALARALAYEPDFLLMDEPFGALDAQTRTQLQSELIKTWQEQKKTCFFITHDVEEAVILATKVIIMSARPGRVKKIVDINLPYPRTQEMKMEMPFLDLKSYIWGEVYQEYLEVRK